MSQGKRPTIDAVVFDFGGVLTLPQRILEELHGYERLLGLPAETLVMALGSGPAWRAVSIGAIGEDAYWEQAAAGFAERLPPAFARLKHGGLLYEELNEEMVELAGALRQQVKVGLLSNATVSLGAYLGKLPHVSHLFNEIVISAEVGMRKPDAAVYELIARRLDVEMERAVLIDDKERNVLAARQAGMRAIVYQAPARLRDELRRLGLNV